MGMEAGLTGKGEKEANLGNTAPPAESPIGSLCSPSPSQSSFHTPLEAQGLTQTPSAPVLSLHKGSHL